MSLTVEVLFWYVLAFCTDSCSASSCDFGVPVREGELRLFLLCRLGRSHEGSAKQVGIFYPVTKMA